MLKTTLIAAVTAIAITGGAFATAAPAAAAPAGYITVHGTHHSNHWHKRPGHGKPWVKRARHCEPIIRWQRVGYHKHRPVVVGWDCGRRHHRHWR